MESHIQQWGNSLGLRIPIQMARKLNLHPGSPVNIEVDDGRIVIKVQYTLDTMLENITPQNQHHLLLDDQKKGREEW